MSNAQAIADLTTGIDAIAAALVTGDVVVEYEIRGRRVRRMASPEVQQQMIENRARLRKEDRSSGMRLAKLNRPTSTGLS